MSSNGANTAEDIEMAECDGEKVVTMMDVLQEQEEFEENANAVLGASDDKECTYSKGYIKRQAIYACLTCCSDAKSDHEKRAGICLACSLNCHENHELVELYTKRNFRCDCGNPKFNAHPCTYTPDKPNLNEDNHYDQNFSGLYCVCHRPYPDPDTNVEEEMIQCIVCEDWLHASHLEAVLPPNELYAEMICKGCMENNEFLHDYSEFAVNYNDNSIIDVDDSGMKTSVCNGDTPKPVIEDQLVEGNHNEKGTTDVKMHTTVEGEVSNDFMVERTTESTEKNESKEANDSGSSSSQANVSDDTKELTKTEETVPVPDISNADDNVSQKNDEEKLSQQEESPQLPTTDDSKEIINEKADPQDKAATVTVTSQDKEVEEKVESKETLKNSVANSSEPEQNGTTNSDLKDAKPTSQPSLVDSNVGEVIKDDTISEIDKLLGETDDKKQGKEKESEMDVSKQTSKVNVDTPTEEAKVELEQKDGSAKTDSILNGSEESKASEEMAVSDEAKITESELSNATSDTNEPKLTNGKEIESHINIGTAESIKRKLSTEEAKPDDGCAKKPKVDNGLSCTRPKGVKRVFKGATFWPSNFRQKLCTCNECITMYKDLSVLFLIDLEDTVTAYETLGKEKGQQPTQYEKGLQALSSLDRVQQINAMTEYNIMKEKLLDFLKGYKDRKEVVKEEDIKAFFAGMKPKREPDGVYFCR